MVLPGGDVYLTGDAGWTYGNGWVASGTSGASGTISNSQCSLNLAASSVSGTGNNLTATLSLTFKSGLPGPQGVFMLSSDNSGLDSGWQQMGTWTTSAVSNQPPTVGSATPSSGTGMTQTFSYTASSVNGASYLMQMFGLFNSGIIGTNACLFYFDRAGNQISLLNDGSSACCMRRSEVAGRFPTVSAP